MRRARPAAGAAWGGAAVWVGIGMCWSMALAWTGTLLAVAPAGLIAWDQLALVIAVALAPLVLGTVIARHAWGNPVAVAIAAAGTCLVITNTVTGDQLGPFEGTWMLLYLPFALVMLIVPDGRAASRRWRAVGVTITAVVCLFIGAVALSWSAPGLASPLLVVSIVLLFAFFGLLTACAIAPIARYRRVGELERMRLRWVFLTGLSLPLTLLLCWASYVLIGGPDLVGVGLVAMYLLIPAGVTVALVRPQLLDIDRAAVGVVSVLSLAVALVGILSIASAVSGVALIEWAPLPAIGLSAALTLAGALVFPVVRRAFDRLLYPDRARALAAVRRLTGAVDAGAAEPEDIAGVLREALRDPGLAVVYRSLADGRLVRISGTDAGVDVGTDDAGAGAGADVRVGGRTTPIRLRGEEIGAIGASRGRVKAPPHAVARAATPLIEAVRVRAELARAKGEVEASRERLLLAGYEERRRLERDLHDGAQQRLVALGMRLRVLQRATPDAPGVSDALDAAVAELGTAVAELRQIAHGVRPSALDDGIGPALAALVRLAPDTIELDVPHLDIPDAVATTAYYVVSEAVANALRHSAASRISVVVRGDDRVVRVRVSDDGRGGAMARPTGGLTGLTDRVGAIGGRLTVHSPAGLGTTLEAVLPCGS